MMKKPGRDNKIAVVVGTITDDARIYEIPKLKVGRQFLLFWQFFRSTPSRPNNISGSQMSVRPSVHPQKVSSILMKFGV